jgi:isoaspartyl peptidase/L-asparaginase-like protein (Ntn-hydrolase superfamily)
MDYGNQTLSDAVQALIDGMDTAGPGRDGQGGIVSVDANGNFAAIHSTVGMIHGMTSDRIAPIADQ